MAITNYERREIAERLRKCGGRGEFAEIIGFLWEEECDWYWQEIAVNISYLIEPEQEKTCTLNEFENIYGCSECGNIAHVFTRPNYCPNCGAKVIDN